MLSLMLPPFPSFFFLIRNIVFSPLTYIDTARALYEKASTDAEKKVILSQITEFGQFPLQLFRQRHPKRSDIITVLMKKELTMEKLILTPEKARPASEATPNTLPQQVREEADRSKSTPAETKPESGLNGIKPLFSFTPHQRYPRSVPFVALPRPPFSSASPLCSSCRASMLTPTHSRINSIAVTSDGRIITVSKDKVIRVFAIEDYQRMRAPCSSAPFKFSVKQVRSFVSEFEPLCAALDSANENLLYYGTVADAVYHKAFLTAPSLHADSFAFFLFLPFFPLLSLLHEFSLCYCCCCCCC